MVEARDETSSDQIEDSDKCDYDWYENIERVVGIEEQERYEDEEESFPNLVAQKLDVLQDSRPFDLCTNEENAERNEVYRQ